MILTICEVHRLPTEHELQFHYDEIDSDLVPFKGFLVIKYVIDMAYAIQTHEKHYNLKICHIDKM